MPRYTLDTLFRWTSVETLLSLNIHACPSLLVRLSPPTGVLAAPEDYPLVHVVKETITGKWSGDGDQVP